FILRLREWARKLEIVLQVIAIGLLVFGFFRTVPLLLDRDAMDTGVDQAMEQKRQEIVETYKPEKQKEELKKLDKLEKITRTVAPVFIYGVFSIMIIVHVLFIFFLTRPKVKEQFSTQLIR
ncbi:hypothetical protein ACFL1E_06730, partial [Candidatus Omnitrophota bacterium]